MEEKRILTHGRAIESLCHIDHVDNNGLDSISFAFDLGNDFRHLVPVELVGQTAVDIDRSHVCCF